MPVKDYSTTPSNNTAISGIAIAEGAPAGNFNNAFRQFMADVKADWNERSTTATFSPDVYGATGDGTTDDKAALQAMFLAGLTLANTAVATNLTIVFRLAPKCYRTSGEIISEAGAQIIWDMTRQDVRIIIDGNGARIKASNWAAQTATRTSGIYDENSVTDAVPSAMLRWEQSPASRGWGPTIKGPLILEGEDDHETDPIGVQVRNINLNDWRGLTIYKFRNVGLHMEQVFNSNFDHIQVSQCGYQLSNNNISSATTFDVTGTAVVASAATFSADDVGRRFGVAGAGASGTGSFWSTIAAYTDSTHVTLTDAVDTNVTGEVASFGPMTGGISADDDELTIHAPQSKNLVGHYVGVMKAGSKKNTGLDVLYTLVTAQTATTLTLATEARDDAASVVIVTFPQVFYGKSDLQVDSGGTAVAGTNNDVTFTNIRVESTHSHLCSVPMLAQNIYSTNFSNGSKFHGTAPSWNNFGCNWAGVILDQCRAAYFGPDCQVEHSMHSPVYGAVYASGAHNDMWFLGNIGSLEDGNAGSMFYLDPQDASGSEFSNHAFYVSAYRLSSLGFADDQVPVRVSSTGNPLMIKGPGSVRRFRQGGWPEYLPTTEMGNVTLIGDTAAITGRETDVTPQVRLVANGGGWTFQRDAADDGTFEQTMLTLTASIGTFGGVVKLATGTVASMPVGAVTAGAGAVAYVSNGNSGSPCLAVSDGTNWLRIALGAAIST